ncbi:ATP-dependent sacrificial sulfur transferase LarE [Caldicellulosiruptoraceae bacterium PP1]
MNTYEKFNFLKNYLSSLDGLIVAFSGGVDSSFLLKVAFDVLGDKVLAVTAISETFPQRELEKAKRFTQEYGIKHIVITTNELSIEGFSKNPVNRCYLCKKELFTKMFEVAKKNNITNIAEGSNYNDLDDYRPGLKAIEELKILSPLRQAKLTKDEIRFLSKEIGLNTWNLPSFACLSSRFPYGEEITKEKIEMIDKAEQFLINMGFSQVRVRYHGNIGRIEVKPEEMAILLNNDNCQKVYNYFKSLGFIYPVLDLKGYRTGSMNETLNLQKQGL